MLKRAVLLHNIRSAHNVGSIFRTADAAGVSKVYLSGYTPLPVDRFGREQKDIAKTALGAHTYIPWEHVKNLAKFLSEQQKGGWHIAAVEQSRNSINYRMFKSRKPILYIFGNEVRGISRQLLEKSDIVLEIPMHGKKESLNVSVAAGVVLFGTL